MQILAAANRLPDPRALAAPRASEDYNAIAAAILLKCRAGETLSDREIRRGSWCLWETEPALAGTLAFRVILAGVEEAPGKRPFRALASSFMQSFDPTRDGMEATGQALASKAAKAGRPWIVLQYRYAIFEPKRGPDLVAQAAIDAGRSPTKLLSDEGLGSLNAQSGYARACAARSLERLAADVLMAGHRRFELVRAIGLHSDKRLIFEDHAPLVANALILPFRNAPLDQTLQHQILNLALGLFGDPRLPSKRWSRMEEAAAVVRRWLIRASLRQFFDVVDVVATERMWKYRRAFWEAVDRAELILDARVVFAKDGALVARRSFGAELPFSIFAGGTVQANHAVLLMRTGRGVVAEWSHNGKCIIWSDAEDPMAPRLHQREYDPSRLRHPSATDALDRHVFAVSHVHSDQYSWQGKVAAKLHQMTGVRIAPADYGISQR
ncbi:EH_Signature domain-containing protein [Methylocella tundrae]|uniref:EH_Signature domain-containing protein n=1 Tax=Methylocella tundrae TaxID=227605 RepID=A0A4U8Z4P3_METTU|nr:EH signature domain-containing protein [Methylocella tundrae]VFU10491.1 EH_Signature domain-containing protein [Methylocella tundrae]